MQLEFREDEVKALVKLAFVGNEIINGIRGDGDKLAEFESLVHKIYKAAFEAGMNKEIGHFESDKTYDVSPEFGEEAYKIIDEYDDETFWEELAYRLSERDTDMSGKEFGSNEERMADVWAREGLYAEEIMENGIARLAIDESIACVHHEHNHEGCSCGCEHDHHHNHKDEE